MNKNTAKTCTTTSAVPELTYEDLVYDIGNLLDAYACINEGIDGLNAKAKNGNYFTDISNMASVENIQELHDFLEKKSATMSYKYIYCFQINVQLRKLQKLTGIHYNIVENNDYFGVCDDDGNVICQTPRLLK